MLICYDLDRCCSWRWLVEFSSPLFLLSFLQVLQDIPWLGLWLKMLERIQKSSVHMDLFRPWKSTWKALQLGDHLREHKHIILRCTMGKTSHRSDNQVTNLSQLQRASQPDLTWSCCILLDGKVLQASLQQVDGGKGSKWWGEKVVKRLGLGARAWAFCPLFRYPFFYCITSVHHPLCVFSSFFITIHLFRFTFYTSQMFILPH